MDEKRYEEDCLSCRMISGFGFIAMGSYVYYQGRKTRGLQNFGFTVIASGFGIIGLARLLNLGPFKRSVEDDLIALSNKK